MADGRCPLDRIAEVATFEGRSKRLRSAASSPATRPSSGRQFSALLAPILHALDVGVTPGPPARPAVGRAEPSGAGQPGPAPRCLTRRQTGHQSWPTSITGRAVSGPAARPSCLSPINSPFN